MIDISGHLRNYRSDYGFEDNENYLVVNCCGYQKFISKNFTVTRENGRLDYQIIYIAGGSGCYKTVSGFQKVKEGNIVIYRPGETQHYSYLSGNNPEVYWIHFTGYGAESLLEKTVLSVEQIFYAGVNSALVEVFKSIIHELQVKKPFFEISVTSLFLELLTGLGRSKIEHNRTLANNKHAELQRILELMHTDYSRKWRVTDFAKICNLSKFRFIHFFKENTGMPPMDYLLTIRIDKAKELLNGSSLNIAEIAEVLGYDDPLYFSRYFKNATGVSPKRYRSMSRGQIH